MEEHFVNLFGVDNPWLQDRICIEGISDKVNSIVWALGGPAKASKAIGCKYSALKEWHLGRAPIPVLRVKQLLNSLPVKSSALYAQMILRKNPLLSCKSKHRIKLPNRITPKLAYVIGLILGDGHLACDKSNGLGSWGINVSFDNAEHLKLYAGIIYSLFNIRPKHFKNDNCYECYFASKIVHWYLRSFFGVPNGAKHDIIRIPQRLLGTNDKVVIGGCLRGLFDSDGSVKTSSRTINFASTSKAVVEQMYGIVAQLGIAASTTVWHKSNKYKPLYFLYIGGKDNLLKFRRCVGFSHPIKRQKLNRHLKPRSVAVKETQ